MGTGGGTTTVLESKRSFCAGQQSVTLRFLPDPRGIGSGTITVSVAGVVLGSVVVPAGTPASTPQTFTFTGTTAADGKLSISTTSNDQNNGPILVEVAVN